MYSLCSTLPGYVKDDVNIEAGLDLIAAALKQLCEHPYGALTALEHLEVKRA